MDDVINITLGENQTWNASPEFSYNTKFIVNKTNKSLLITLRDGIIFLEDPNEVHKTECGY